MIKGLITISNNQRWHFLVSKFFRENKYTPNGFLHFNSFIAGKTYWYPIISGLNSLDTIKFTQDGRNYNCNFPYFTNFSREINFQNQVEKEMSKITLKIITKEMEEKIFNFKIKNEQYIVNFSHHFENNKEKINFEIFRKNTDNIFIPIENDHFLKDYFSEELERRFRE